MNGNLHHLRIPLPDLDLAATLDSGQAFRWERRGDAWEGIVAGRWVRLHPAPGWLEAQTLTDPEGWDWLRHYLALDDDLPAIHASFPPDAALREAVASCSGLRLLRQDPWECLASFILSSTKQITQIRQVVRHLADRHGQPLPVPAGTPPVHSFPTAATLAAAGERALRECRMGFRAPYLAATAAAVAERRLDWSDLRSRPLASAREALMALPGVGRKIADCVLLFSLGFREAFPIDVWVLRVLRESYPARRRASPRAWIRFSETHFGPYAGYAQQYLFHWRRAQAGRVAPHASAARPPNPDSTLQPQPISTMARRG